MSIQSKTIELPAFTAVAVKGWADLILDQQTSLSTHQVTIEAEDDLLPYLQCEVKEGRLVLGFNVPWWDLSFWLVRMPSFLNKRVKYHAIFEKFTSCSLSGSGTVSADHLEGEDCKLTISGSGKYLVGSLHARNITANLSGSGSFKFDEVISETLSTQISGSGKLEAAGKLNQQTLRLSGSGTLDTQNLETQETRLHISGSGTARINAQQRLEVNISGSGSIRYVGEPQIEKKVSGSGSIRKLV